MNSNPLPTNTNFTDPKQLPAMLWLVEGNIPRLYADTEGIPTIGIGVGRAIAPSPTKMSLLEGIAHLTGAPEIRQRLGLLKQKWVGVVGASVAAVLAAGAAAAQDSPSTTPAVCIQQPVAFDGIKPLQYATVGGDASTGTPLYRRYPASCTTTGAGDCADFQPLKAGTPVAIGKTCGSWSYAQYIGTTTVTNGWIASDRLKSLSLKLPYDDGEPGGRTRQSYWQPVTTIRVKLTQGEGLPVCEAYLQRLNQTVFHEPPSCGRPENDQVPGFTRLHRVPLPASDVNASYPKAYNLSHKTSYGEQLIGPVEGRPDVAAMQMVAGMLGPIPIPALPNNAKVSAWRFDPWVDIDNDGKPDDVVIWRNWPPRWDGDSELFACGFAARTAYQIESVDQVPFVFSGHSLIDITKSVAVFGDPTPLPKGQRLDPALPTGEQSYQWLRPRGPSVEIFEYGGKYYFDTSKEEPGKTVLDQNTLVVYLREHDTTRQVCTYQNMDPEWKRL
jgi:hypothetical protein